MPDFWRSSHYGLMRADSRGQLVVSDDFLRATLHRPELLPQPDSRAEERALFDRLVADPAALIGPRELAAIRDPDTAQNFAVWLRFRQRLIDWPTLEQAYLALFAGAGVDIPAVLLRQLTQILLRHVIGDDATPFEARAAEMLFRAQRIALTQAMQVLAADAEAVARQDGPEAALPVLHETNANDYWQADEACKFAVFLNRDQPTLGALCRVMEKWVRHFTGAAVQVAPADVPSGWAWHIGLDTQSSAVLDDLYRGQTVVPGRVERVLSYFWLKFEDPAVAPRLAGEPVLLAMAMDEQQVMRLKPQNLLLNLPLGAG